MRSVILLQLAFSLTLCGSVLGADYWPLDPDRVYHYQDDSGKALTVTYLDWGSGRVERESACTSSGLPLWWTWEMFEVDSGGDVVLAANSHYFQGAIDPDFMLTYSPALKFIDLPLAVGKVWANTSVAHGYGDRDVIHWCSIERAETVTVPYGTFDTLVMVETDLLFTAEHRGTYYLTPDLGPVILPGGFKLVDVDGVVGVESTTWGELKSLFR